MRKDGDSRPRRDNARCDETALDGTGSGAEFWTKSQIGEVAPRRGTTDLRCSLVRRQYIGPIEAMIVNVQSDLLRGMNSLGSMSGRA